MEIPLGKLSIKEYTPLILIYHEVNHMLNSITEEWKSIQELDNMYYISNLGNMKNAYGRILKPFVTAAGYKAIHIMAKTLKEKGMKNHYLIHRLVAMYFVPNPDNLPVVNHIDGNKLNNRFDNLEWVTTLENASHAWRTGLCESLRSAKNTLGKKHLKNTLSKYHNVSYDKNRCKWTACIRENGHTYGQKRFDTEEEAALWVNRLIDVYHLTGRPKNVIDKCPTTISQESTHKCVETATTLQGVLI